MKKKITILITAAICLSFLVYIGTHNSKEWTKNDKPLIDSPYDFSDEESLELIYRDLQSVEYAAIIYPTAYRAYPNSWLHKLINENFHLHGNTTYEMEGDIYLTLIGKEYKQIKYGSAGGGLPNYPILVALCEEDGGLYAPDLGYERPASKELIEHLKNADKSIFNNTQNKVCP